MLNRRAILLAGAAAGCSSGDSRSPPDGWVVRVPGGGWIRTFGVIEPFASGCNDAQGRPTEGDIALLVDLGGVTNTAIKVAVGAANIAAHESLEAFGAATVRRISCGAFGAYEVHEVIAVHWAPDARPPPRRRLLWATSYTFNGVTEPMNSPRLLWESEDIPLRLCIWENRAGRAAALRRAEAVARTFTLIEPFD